MIYAGIDEAGYGPTLGPLVMTLTGFNSKIKTLQPFHINVDFNKSLPFIADSKLVYRSKSDFPKLEAIALAIIMNYKPSLVTNNLTFAKLIDVINKNNELKRISKIDWYSSIKSLKLPIMAKKDEVLTIKKKIQKVLSNNNSFIDCINAQILTAFDFNNRLEDCENKSELLFSVLTDLLCLFKRRRNISVVVDNHGSKRFYKKSIIHHLGVSPVVCKEERGFSEYTLFKGNMNLSFYKKADVNFPIVSMSSIISKYIREIMIKEFNKFWIKRYPHIKPTAGYPYDARRFLKELGNKVCRDKNISNKLIRKK